MDEMIPTTTRMPAKNKISGWEYRVLKRTFNWEEWFKDKGGLPENHDKTEDVYGIYECYVDKMGKVHSMTEDPVYPTGNTKEELEAEIKHYIAALNLPVLDYDKIPEPSALPLGVITVKDLMKEAKSATEIIKEMKASKE